MKKTSLLLLLILALQLSVVAQRIYFKGQVGYDFGFLKTANNLSSNNIVQYIDSTSFNSSYQSYRNSYGTGVSFNAGVGIMVTRYLGFELTGFYTVCKEQKFAAEDRIQDQYGYHFKANTNYIIKGTCYGIKPALTLTLPGKELRPYTRIGAILSFSDVKENMNMDVSTDNPNYIPYDGMQYMLQYKRKLSAGVNVSLGLEYMILDRLWLYAELEGNIVNYFPVGASFTNYVVSRQDITDQLTVHEREITFVKSYSDYENLSNNEPTKALPVHYSFSSIGVNIGLKYTLFD